MKLIISFRFSILVGLIILALPLCFADSSGGILIGKQNQAITLPQECASCTYVKLTTITFPDMSQLSIQVNMAQDGTSYSYVLNGANTTQLGSYVYCTVGDVDGTATPECKDFSITVSGTIPTTGQGLLYMFFVILAFAIFILCMYGAIIIPWGNITGEQNEIIGISYMKYLKLFCIVFAYITFMLAIGLATGIASNFTNALGVSGMFSWIYFIMLSFLWPLIVCSLIFALLKYLNDKKLMKALIRGVPLR